MKSYIKEFVPNMEVTSFFLVPEMPTTRKSKRDKDYLCLKLVDKTGEIDGRVWDIPAGLDPKTLSKKIVKAKGQISEWLDQKQMSIVNIRPVMDSDEIDMSDFFESSKIHPDVMWMDLSLLISEQITYDLIRGLITHILNKHVVAFKRSPAARGKHHAYIGGLLEHTLSMCHLAVNVCSHYELNTSLVLAGLILHDLGKVFELSSEMGISYTKIGTLVGHIPLSMIEIDEAIIEIRQQTGCKIPEDVKIALLHIVAAHHGKLEWGSPKTPLMREALVVHHIDMIDSQLALIANAIAAGTDEENMTDWVKEFNGPIFVFKEV